MFRHWIGIFLFWCVCLLSAFDTQALEFKKQTKEVSVQLLTNFDKIHPQQNLDVLIKFTMKNGWHIFSQNPGDIGLPTKISWNLPLGYEVKDQLWSVDEEFENEGIIQRGYGDVAYYRATIVPTPDVFRVAQMEAEVSWLACREECLPKKVKFYLDIPITQQDLRPSQKWTTELNKAIPYFTVQANVLNIGFCLAVLMAFVGGIILNFMPCVFPILVLKVIALGHTSEDDKHRNILEGLIYTLGVLLSFIAMASVLVWLRMRGEQVGWGFQLQSPVFVSIMLVLFFVIFLLLLDVVNIPNPLVEKVGKITFKRQMWNAFFTGFFAVLIASPCTAPFMGIAVGYTLTAPLYVYYPIFISLALGYALPFALAGMFPKLLHRSLPRPGRWMARLKRLFAIPVLLTCFWLAWVLYSQLDKRGEIVLGQRLNWQVYSAEAVAEDVKNKEKVFVEFTAKWCLTCLMNKKVALQSEDFVAFAKENNIKLYRADWTNDDDDITQALAKYGRNSVPLYVYYDGTSKSYRILPQILTPGILVGKLR